jgi:hypothetical protein
VYPGRRKISRHFIKSPCVGPDPARFGVGISAYHRTGGRRWPTTSPDEVPAAADRESRLPVLPYVHCAPSNDARLAGMYRLTTPVSQHAHNSVAAPENRSEYAEQLSQPCYSCLNNNRFQKSGCSPLKLRRSTSLERQPRSQIKGKLSEWLLARPWLPKVSKDPGDVSYSARSLPVSGKKMQGLAPWAGGCHVSSPPTNTRRHLASRPTMVNLSTTCPGALAS